MNRDQKIQTSLTKAEKAFLEAAAKLHRRTVANYVRLAIMYQVNNDLALGDIPDETEVPAPVPAWADPPPNGHVTLHESRITQAIVDVIENLNDENYMAYAVYTNSGSKQVISKPYSAACHLLDRLQGDILNQDVIRDLTVHLAPIANADLVKRLCMKTWPVAWLSNTTGLELIDGNEYFTPDLQQAKFILSSLADQTLPGQTNHPG